MGKISNITYVSQIRIGLVEAIRQYNDKPPLLDENS